MTQNTKISDGHGRTILIVVAHADDPALFLGGTIALWAKSNWRIVVVRVTDDRWDSLELSEDSTIQHNKEEFDQAMLLLGVTEIVELDWPTDVLGDRSEVELRERIIREIRRHRPYSLVTFDPNSMFHEDNEDHILVAKATAEAFWTAQFDKHHPEHLTEGLRPFGVFERWYFGRRVVDVTDVIDISTTLDTKIAAALCSKTMLINMAHQWKLQARTGGWQVPLIEQALKGDLRPLFESMLQKRSTDTGERYGLNAAEEFRVIRFGGLSDWLTEHGTSL